jgi:short-subunit dehydrogenase
MSRLVGKRVIILGAVSAIGEAVARLYAAEASHVVLAGRNSERLFQIANDLRARGASECREWSLDLAATADPGGEFARMVEAVGGQVDVVLVFYGALGNQKKAESDAAEARNIIDVNFTSAACWCLASAAKLEEQQCGVLLVVSSVAGDRGRQSNYIYGAAKAGITTLCQGLAHRLAHTNARVVVAKLGFVDTPMTAHIEKRGPLWSTPAKVATLIKAAADNRRATIVYVPSFWRWIMLVVRLLPSSLLHKTKL